MSTNETNLDCSCPEYVATILRKAAQAYRESTSDLQSAWGDEKAGLVWSKLADELERSAKRCEAITAKYFV